MSAFMQKRNAEGQWENIPVIGVGEVIRQNNGGVNAYFVMEGEQPQMQDNP